MKQPFPVYSIDGVHRVMVAASDGILYVGSIDPREGGECKIAKEFRSVTLINAIRTIACAV